MTIDFELPDDVHEHVAKQLLGKTWDEIEVLEHAGYLLFPAELYRRRRDGTFETIAVCLRVPRMPDIRKARLKARTIAANEGLDHKLDAGAVADLETVCILAEAIRNSTAPHEPMIPDPLELERVWDKTSLVQLWAKLDGLNHVIDPRPHDITEIEMLALLARLAKEQTLAPLAVYGSGAQAYFVTTMAARLLTLLESKSSSEPSDASMPV